MNRREVLWIVLFLTAGAVGLALFHRFYQEAFPVASLNFKMSRKEAFGAAQDYLKKLGYSTEGYKSAQIFSQEEMPQIFLERTLGLKEANRLARTWVSIWAWRVRWFRPLQKESFEVRLDPGGRVVNFDHRILDSEAGANLSQEAARPIAERFLRDVQGFKLADYEEIEHSSVKRKSRTDHTFTFRKRGFTVGDDGQYRLKVVVQGNRVGSFSEFLKVPEGFRRSYAEVRSRANLLTEVATLGWLALTVAMIVVLMRGYRDRTLRWRTGLIVGGLVAVTSMAAKLNSLPMVRFGYPTTASYAAFLLGVLAMGLLGAVGFGGMICLVGTAGETARRKVMPGGGRFSLRRVVSAGFVRSICVGYGLAFAMLGYVTLFYIVGTRYFGVWSPAWMVDYDNTFSTAVPWIYPLLIGLSAAALEEFFFRLLAIPLLIRWLKRRWLAVLLPAIVWGFLHSNYPVEPIYTRGLELTAVGVVFGLVFLRFGILATVAAHYVFDAFLTAFPMLKSSSLYFQVSGVAVIAVLFLPAIPGLFAVLTGRAKQPEPEEEDVEIPGPTLEAEEPAETPRPAPEPEEKPEIPETPVKEEGVGTPGPTPEPKEAPEIPETPARKGPEDYVLDPRRRMLAGIFALAGAALLIVFWTRPFGARTLVLSTTRGVAVQKAEAFCQKIGLNLKGYRQTATFRSGLASPAYAHLVRNAGIARADTLASEETAPWMWRVRWYRPLQKEEVRVGVDGTGRVAYFEHAIPDSQAGASLSEGAARAIAEAFLARYFDRTVTDTTRYKPLEAQSQKRKARVDHDFTWERIDRKVDDGEFRTVVRVQGDQVGHVHFEYKAPEAFIRAVRKQRTKDVIAAVVGILFVLSTLVLAAVFFFRLFRAGQISRTFALWMGALAAGLFVVGQANGLPGFFFSYNTSQTLQTYLGFQVVTRGMGLVILVLSVAGLAALTQGLFRSACPEEIGLAEWPGALRNAGVRFWADAVLLGAALSLSLRGLGMLGRWMDVHWLAAYLKTVNFGPAGLNTFLPALSTLVGAGQSVISLVLILGTVLVWRRVLRRKWALLAAVTGLALLFQAVRPAEDFTQFGFLAGFILVQTALLLFLVVRIVRFHLPAYLASVSGFSLVPVGLALLKTPVPFYQTNGAVILLLGLWPLALLLIAYLRERRAGLRASP